jgi:hypothetical protein
VIYIDAGENQPVEQMDVHVSLGQTGSDGSGWVCAIGSIMEYAAFALGTIPGLEWLDVEEAILDFGDAGLSSGCTIQGGVRASGGGS